MVGRLAAQCKGGGRLQSREALGWECDGARLLSGRGRQGGYWNGVTGCGCRNCAAWCACLQQPPA
jgi:hypothetical protein